ncbi:conserved hypothetical protein [Talaromyces stipitatus ATCC 10500]|uniref:Uncharacterized protein n=1 Tax=Talaromyces stipitatus (strain ATCC 10500 / CBS 375.48 / QM 6759 / NRRL 1006) TaxID=441959 RepID=B8MEI3_TALSN|nr:uncharacterized protein TSTA_016850 [Talaromyces stipitatus ATCC 10500]EED16610.1 conserved hypothetical protein [Talaromyces stipitatus ATCC 10500]
MEPIECEINLSDIDTSENENDIRANKEMKVSLSEGENDTSESEDMEDLSELKGNLLDTLSEIQSNGTFITAKELSTAIIPGLHVPGIGAIGLPVTPDQVKAMIQSSRMSPYGKGSETLVNESVRKSWQLDANQFSLQNPLWKAQLDNFKKEAITGLGLTANPEEVKAELYKLLIYEEGAFFLPHQDSEKADGMFATLVVSLPSKHQGGDVVASHKDKKMIFSTAGNSEFGFSWAAWYADVMHEVKPVVSGYRIVLVYNMIHRPSAMIVKARDSEMGYLSKLLASWARAVENSMHNLRSWSDHIEDDCPPALVYLLDHKYSIAELRPSRLKGVDQHRFLQLQEACRKNDCEIYLANIEKTTTGDVYEDDYHDDYYGSYGRGRRLNGKDFHNLEEVYESSLELLHVVDTKGVVVGAKLSFPESMIVQSDIFERDPDDEDFEGFTGNEGAHATHFFRETDLIMKRALELTDFGLFGRALLLAGYFSDSHIALIAQVIADHGITPIRKPLDTMIKGTDQYGHRSGPRLHILSDIMKEYQSVCTQTNRSLSNEVIDWQNVMFLNAISAQLEGSESDGQKLAKSLSNLPVSGSLTKKIEEYLQHHLENTTFIASFIISANECLPAENSHEDAIAGMIRRLFPKAIQSFKIEHESNLSFSGAHTNSHTSYGWKNICISPTLVIKLIKLASSMETDTDGVMNVLARYANNVRGDAAASAFHEFLFPVAMGICEDIAQTKRSWTAGEKDFLFGLLKSYVNGFVKKASPPPADFKAKTNIRCTCSDCMDLRKFIDDQSVRTRDFSLAEKRRKHLEQQLDRSYFSTDTIQRGSPYKLRVEKTNAMLVSYFNAWVKRARIANSVLEKLSEKGPLKEILGESNYRSILEHTNLQIPTDSPSNNTTTTNARPRIQSTVPQKRSLSGYY